QAGFDLSARLTASEIAGTRCISATRAVLGGTDPDEAPAAGGQLAAAEAIAAVRREGQARIQALGRLGARQLVTALVRACDLCGRVVAAARVAARRKILGRRERIAAMVPVAAIVARPGVLIEVAILAAGRVVLTRKPSPEGVLGV